MPESVPFRPTADVCDEHDDHGGPLPQIVAERFVSLGGRDGFAGVVSTVKALDDNSLVKEAVTEPGEGRVLVIDGGGSMRRSMVGGNVAADAADNDWAGFVVYGAVRDSHELVATDIGVFALGTVPLSVPTLPAPYYIYADPASLVFLPGFYSGQQSASWQVPPLVAFFGAQLIVQSAVLPVAAPAPCLQLPPGWLFEVR